jgi:hypothetical protein
MRRSKARLSLLITALSMSAVLGASSEARAQRRVYVAPRGRVGVAIFPPGLYAGAGLTATKILSQSGGAELLDDGAGLTLYAGMRLNPRLALEAGWAGTLHNPEQVDTGFGTDVDYLVLNALTGDAKIYFPRPGGRVTPYAQAGIGLYLLDSDYFGAQALGSGFQLGGGFDFELGPFADFGLRALFRGISMGPPESTRDDTFISALSAEANITLHF